MNEQNKEEVEEVVEVADEEVEAGGGPPSTCLSCEG